MRLRAFIKDNEIVFDFDGFFGNSCILEFDKIISLLSKLGLEVRVREVRTKNSSGVENDTNIFERS